MSKSYSPDPGGRSEAHKVLFQVERYLQKREIPCELRWEASWEFDCTDLQGGEVLRFDGRNWVGKLTFSAGPVTVRMLATPHSLVLAPHSLPGGGGYPCKQYSCDDILHILSAAMGWHYVSLRDALGGGRGAFFLNTGLRGAGAPRIMRPCEVSTISTLERGTPTGIRRSKRRKRREIGLWAERCPSTRRLR